MSLIIEDGSGVLNANSYNSLAFILAYLTTRNRNTESSWDTLTTAAQEGHAIAATDFIESRFSLRFKGIREFGDLKAARATLLFTAQPGDTETVVIGSTTYTFNTAVGGANSVLIGVSLSVSIDNLINAVNLGTGIGTVYGTGTVVNAEASASAFEEDTLVARSLIDGTPGNTILSTTTVTGATWSGATLSGGSDIGRSQPLSFPREGLYDRDGRLVCGVPPNVQFAQAEYSVRSAAETLNPDPVVDDRGMMVIEKSETVGPINERTKYQDGVRFEIVKSYPAADRLLTEYLRTGGTVLRA